jgi:hypothetical protein
MHMYTYPDYFFRYVYTMCFIVLHVGNTENRHQRINNMLSHPPNNIFPSLDNKMNKVLPRWQ